MDWTFECERALERCKRGDIGARAACEGLLGLPMTPGGKKAQRCYMATATIRQQYMNLIARRGRTLSVGTTGISHVDAELLKFVQEPIAA